MRTTKSSAHCATRMAPAAGSDASACVHPSHPSFSPLPFPYPAISSSLSPCPTCSRNPGTRTRSPPPAPRLQVSNDNTPCCGRRHGINTDKCYAMQEKRYRSMQEHIRRAHPEHYISKLPATEESFLLMINTPPSERPQPQPGSVANNNVSNHQSKPYVPDRNAYYREDYSNPGTPRPYDEYPHGLLPAAANAAAALTSLHNYKSGGSDWDAEGVSVPQAPYDDRPRCDRLVN